MLSFVLYESECLFFPIFGKCSTIISSNMLSPSLCSSHYVYICPLMDDHKAFGLSSVFFILHFISLDNFKWHVLAHRFFLLIKSIVGPLEWNVQFTYYIFQLQDLCLILFYSFLIFILTLCWYLKWACIFKITKHLLILKNNFIYLYSIIVIS